MPSSFSNANKFWQSYCNQDIKTPYTRNATERALTFEADVEIRISLPWTEPHGVREREMTMGDKGGKKDRLKAKKQKARKQEESEQKKKAKQVKSAS